jgi:hypothetical protein
MIAFAALALTANAQLCSNIRSSCVDFNVQLPFCNKLRSECRKLVVAGFVSSSFDGTIPYPGPNYPNIGCREIYSQCYAKAEEQCDDFLDICYDVFYAKSERRLNTDPPKKL